MADIGRISLSHPHHEFEGLRFGTIKSPALNGRGDISLFVPQSIEDAADLPLVVLLHGTHGSHWNWPLLGGAHRTAAEMTAAGEIAPMALVMPSDGLWGDGSAYVPHAHADYEAWIVEDLLAAMQEPDLWSNGAPPLGPVFLSGLSMGGYGALRLGAKYPQRFQAISAHSAATLFEQMEDALRRDGAKYAVDASTDGSILYWMKKNREVLPPVRFDCGTEDWLVESNRILHRELLQAGIAHVYEEFEGSHTWEYWGAHLRDTLLFFEGIRKGLAV